ncbi:hypothetical protein ACFQZO_29040 [Bradyrhizobium sp. GCM10027634]|nr:MULTISPECIES: hypothetical protein [unclassified Bradyrhizobium]MDN5004905.1 hypothetical protein [Bradyrhizobium sp. WYCCWR 12677]
MTKRLGLCDYAAGKAAQGETAESPDETILRNPRNDPETDAP